MKELYAERGILQKDVAEATGIRPSTLSGLANNARTSWDVQLMERLCVYFELTDISELIEYEPPKDIDAFIHQFNKSKDIQK